MGAQTDRLSGASTNSVLDQPSLSAVFVSGSEDIRVVIKEVFQLVALMCVEAIATALP